MKFASSLSQPMTSIFWPKQANRVLHNTILIILGSLFLAVASQIALPLIPVPITLQTFAVLLIGMTYGWRLGIGAVGLYLLEGTLGIPVFSEMKFGLPVLFGTTGGYLLGFLPAVFISGLLIEKGWGKNTITTFFSALLGISIISFLGFLMLASYVGWDMALKLGILPFLPTELVKVIALSILVPLFWKAQKDKSQK